MLCIFLDALDVWSSVYILKLWVDFFWGLLSLCAALWLSHLSCSWSFSALFSVVLGVCCLHFWGLLFPILQFLAILCLSFRLPFPCFIVIVTTQLQPFFRVQVPLIVKSAAGLLFYKWQMRCCFICCHRWTNLWKWKEKLFYAFVVSIIFSFAV